MLESEYINLLNDLKGKITNDYNVLNKINDELDKLYNIKPVRLLWFVVKAQVVFLLTNNVYKAKAILDNKVWILYNYDSVDEYLKFNMNISKAMNDEIDNKRFINHLNKLIGHDENLQRNYNRNYYEEFLTDKTNEELIKKIIEDCYVEQNYVLEVIIAELFENNKLIREWVKTNASNIGYLQEKLRSNNKDCFIVLESEADDNLKEKVVAKSLAMLGKKVYYITRPNIIEVKNLIDLEKTMEVSIANIDNNGQYDIINSIGLMKDGQYIGDNREYIVDYINDKFAYKGLSIVISNGFIMDEISNRKLMQKKFQRLYDFQSDFYENNITFGWYGNYMTYISDIYKYDVQKMLNEEDEYDFSIVIPARNSSYTLKETIKTCLNQRYQGSYEIVISDNSTNDNTEVYDLCREINDPRIKYYKTPRDLHLPKSFEFAYLMARGKFIISIGSDDAILPWALEVITDVLKKYPNKNIIQWERGFYAWPGFNGGQENELFVPREYKKGEYETYEVEREEYLAKVLNNPQEMYSLPMIYINSGFKRSYIKKIYQQTGRLWDGICQDIYMGVVNIGINETILNIKYPITIAGMSSNSIGYTANKPVSNMKKGNIIDKESRATNNIGGFSRTFIERLIPQNLGSDVSSLYDCLLRVVARGIFPIEYIDNLFDFKKMFIECYKLLDVRDVYYDKKIHIMRYTASLHGEEFLKWFDDTIYKEALIPRVIDEEKINSVSKKKTYSEGKTELGGIILDASKYNVSNIYEASKLFEKITNL